MVGAIISLVVGVGFAVGSLFAQTSATEFGCYFVSLVFLLGAAIGSDSERPSPKEGDSYIP